MSNKIINFDDIHTEDKQKRLKSELTKISEQIRLQFPLASPVSKCPCCTSEKIGFYVERYGYSIDLCGQCGHLFTNPFPTDDALKFFYNSEFKDFENKFFRESFEHRIPIFQARIELLKEYGIGKKLLDIGAAIGVFYEANLRSGVAFDMTACDLSESACANLKERYPELDVICSDVNELGRRHYDCVTLWDTIEHIVDPELMLSSVRNLLHKDGVFVFSTPNTLSYEWKVMREEHVQILPPGHVNLYNTENITILLERSGWKVEAIHTLNPSLDLSYISKMLGTEESRDNSFHAKSGSIFHEMLLDEDFFDVVCKQMRSKRMGGNMLVIARLR